MKRRRVIGTHQLQTPGDFPGLLMAELTKLKWDTLRLSLESGVLQSRIKGYLAGNSTPAKSDLNRFVTAIGLARLSDRNVDFAFDELMDAFYRSAGYSCSDGKGASVKFLVLN